MNNIVVGDFARKKIAEGIELAYNKVKSNYGSKNIELNGYLTIFDLEAQDKFVNLGVKIIKEEAKEIHYKFGDGTTLLIILIHSLLNDLYWNADNLQSDLKIITDYLKEISMPLLMPRDIFNIINGTSKGNKEIVNYLLEAIDMVGINGTIAIDENDNDITEVMISDGIQVKSKLLQCSTNNTLNDVKILITTKKITSSAQILQILQQTIQTNNPLLIIADGIEGEALSTIKINNIHKTINVCAVKLQQCDVEKIVLATNATMIVDSAPLKALGNAQRVIIDKDNVIFFGCKKKYKSNRLAIIKVGSNDEIEKKSLIKQYQKSLRALTSALSYGVVPAISTSAFFASKKLNLKSNLLKTAITHPLKILIENSQLDYTTITNEIMKKELPYGFNSHTKTIDNLICNGGIESYATICDILQRSVHTALRLASSGVLITN